MKNQSVPAIHVHNLRKSFPTGFYRKPIEILKGVTFDVPHGMSVGFIGNNGSGKTTTLKSLMKFILPESGTVEFFGKALDTKSRSRIGYLPERPYLYEFLTGQEYLKYHWDLSGLPRKDFKEKSENALKKVELFWAKDRRLRNYSKGMLQRVGLAQAILHEPELLILDEPMSGLDPDGRFLVKSILKEHSKAGKSLFFSSHMLEDVEQLCEYLVIIHQGQILYQGSIIDLIKDQGSLEMGFKNFKSKVIS